jgi:hypothetical protein
MDRCFSKKLGCALSFVTVGRQNRRVLHGCLAVLVCNLVCLKSCGTALVDLSVALNSVAVRFREDGIAITYSRVALLL